MINLEMEVYSTYMALLIVITVILGQPKGEPTEGDHCMWLGPAQIESQQLDLSSNPNYG